MNKGAFIGAFIGSLISSLIAYNKDVFYREHIVGFLITTVIATILGFLLANYITKRYMVKK